MKKLLLLFSAALFLVSCKPKTGDQATQKALDGEQPEGVTLNGVKESEALQMMANFKASMSSNSGPKVVNYILNKEMVLNIVKLLNTEKTGGVRIYFGKRNGSTNIELLLVSSKYDHTDPETGEKKYSDYYAHDMTHALFADLNKLKIIEFDGKDPGAELYDPNSDNRRDATCFTPDMDDYLDKGFAKKAIAGFGNHAFNTEAVLFSTATLYNMAKEKDCDGIRVYMATYPKLYDVTKYKERDTFVLTTAKKDGRLYNGQEVYKDYFDCQDEKAKDLVAPLKPYGDIKNNGSLCPYNCN